MQVVTKRRKMAGARMITRSTTQTMANEEQKARLADNGIMFVQSRVVPNDSIDPAVSNPTCEAITRSVHSLAQRLDVIRRFHEKTIYKDI